MRQNRRGPAIAVGDIDGDGRDDVFLGGTSQTPARMLRQATAGHLELAIAQIPARGNALNDGPALLLDVAGKGFCDLIVTSSGTSLPAGTSEYQPRLFFNDGKGAFIPADAAALPPFPVSVGALAGADFDRSGRLGLFLGGRVVPGRYPESPQSALWVNRGGRFDDVTDQLAPGLKSIGMVTSALWCDVDGDGWPDLLLTLEWGTVKYFHNNGGKGFEDWSDRAGFSAAGKGWWTSIAVASYTREGRPNFVVGNAGLNTTYQASAKSPVVLLVGDFVGNGESHLIECINEGGRLYPRRSRKELGAAFPSLLRRFPRNDVYARMTVDELFGPAKVAAAERYEATEFQSGFFRCKEDGTYAFEPLPRIAQISPIQGLLATDLDGDGMPEICAVQNSFSPVPSTGRFDGGLGQLIQVDENAALQPVPALNSGLVVPGDAKALATIELGGAHPALLVSRNNNSTLAFDTRNLNGARSLCVRLKGKPGNPSGIGARICGTRASGKVQWDEVRAGSGYFSQSSASVFLGHEKADPIKTVEVHWPNGATSRHEIDEASTTVTLASPE
ncbi:MAG TPA: CRTAC1 family protein, partial [Opitutaceae bacterium]